MNPARLLIIIVFGYSFLGCRHQPAQDQSIMRICDEKTRLLLREYLRQPKYYQDQDFIEELLYAIKMAITDKCAAIVPGNTTLFI